MQVQKQQPLLYITPRLAILNTNLQIKQNQLEAEVALRSRHNNYFHLFNLSSYGFTQSNLGSIGCTNFKWRQIPFSISETIKILASLQDYQRKNLANTAVLVAANQQSFQFCLFIAQIYCNIVQYTKNSWSNRVHTISQFNKIYKTMDIKNPPVKIIQSFSFKYQQQNFIPIVTIFTQGRHNSFQELHTHNPQAQLTRYYIDKKSPLNQGLGMRYCQKRPQTKYFCKPVVVYGDVKIQVYSYDSLKMQRQFVCGFNTKALEHDQSIIQIQLCDLYCVKNSNKLGRNNKIVIEISDFCEKCKEQSKCSECLQYTKKLGNTYTFAQAQLEKLNRNRSKQECMNLVGLRQ